jgi:radical SAM superfamily enzyme YgiQ (UPF0313 family)
MTRVLLTSIFKPCGVDDAYGRKENISELFHNQLTHYQGIFSIRERYPSLNLHVIAANLESPATVLDWPTLPRFEKELRKGYDYVGIAFIQPNFRKMQKMVEMTREVSPKSKIVLGGYGTTIDDLERIVDVDHICRGEGIGFMRNLLGEPAEYRYRHSPVFSYLLETMGIPIHSLTKVIGRFSGDLEKSAISLIATGVGCTEGCDFCSSGQFFPGGYIPFIRTGREIFELMTRQERDLGVKRFAFIGDENFFRDRAKVEELHRCLRESGKLYEICLAFGSANSLDQYDPEFLSELGLGLVWIGIESKFHSFRKNAGVDIPRLAGNLHQWGIKTILSSILCLEEHTRENIVEDINWHLSLKPTFSQFAQLSPAQGTKLWRRLIREDRILHSVPLEERHGFKQIWFKHPHFTPYESELIQKEAYLRDYHELGPAAVRSIENDYRSYAQLLRSGSELLRRRAEQNRGKMKSHKMILWAAEQLVPTAKMSSRIRDLRKELERDFGKMSAVDYLGASALFLFGKEKELEIKWFGDAIQPPTRVTRFNR